MDLIHFIDFWSESGSDEAGPHIRGETAHDWSPHRSPESGQQSRECWGDMDWISFLKGRKEEERRE